MSRKDTLKADLLRAQAWVAFMGNTFSLGIQGDF